MERKKSQCSIQCLTRKRWKKANAQFNGKRAKGEKKTMTNVMAEVRIAKKNLMPKQWSFGQCCRINGEQSNQWLFEAL